LLQYFFSFFLFKGIEMFDLVTSVTVVVSLLNARPCSLATVVTQTDARGERLVDADAGEERASGVRALTTVALLPSVNAVTLLSSTGEIDVDGTVQAIELCMDGCASLIAPVREAVWSQEVGTVK
jgi:hypothetical protein